MAGFDGILSNLTNYVSYDPGGFKLSDLEGLFKEMDSLRRPSKFQILMDGYGMAVWNNDEVEIARYKRLHRVEYLQKWKRLVNTYGIGLAKVIDYLDKYGNGFRDSGYSGNTWSSSPSNFVWGDYGRNRNEYDDSYASLVVTMVGDRFEIKITGNDGHGYDYKEKILSPSASYKSVVNQINYFHKKFSHAK
jgi:hypothetical protein